MSVVGVDGCRGGWFYVDIDGTEARYGVASDLEEVLRSCPEATRVLVDVPIGLPESPPGTRECDVAARKLLGPRRSRVFPAPCRQAAYADSYEEANRINRETIGRGLSKQAWAIAPKIREVDELLETSEAARKLVREVHPEVCFWALAGGRPMELPKRNERGLAERIELLEQHWPGAGSLVREASATEPRSRLAVDDVVDALAAAVSGTFDTVSSLPEEPPRDIRGLPMQMVYSSADKATAPPAAPVGAAASSPHSLQTLSRAVRDFCQARDWGQFHGPKDLAIGVVTEAAELLEHFRFLSPEDAEALLTDPTHRHEIEDELADILFFLLRFADRHDVDLERALTRKLAKNAERYPVDKARGKNLKYTDL